MCLYKTQICVRGRLKSIDSRKKLCYDIRVGAVFRPVFMRF